MKEEDLSRIKRYPIVEYLDRKGIKPVRRTPSYALYCSPLREETQPSFKVDTEKNLWIDYGEGRGGSIIDLCMRMEGCTLSEAIRRLGQNASEYTAHSYSKTEPRIGLNQTTTRQASGTRRLIEISDTLPPHLQEYLKKERCIDLEKATPFLKCISYEVRGRRYEAIGFANSSGGYELRDNNTFKGTVAPKDITPIFENKAQPVYLFEGFMDFLSFLSMKGEVTNQCLVMNSVSNVARSICYLNKRNITSVRTFLDNDDTGRKAVQEFVNAGFKVEDMAVYYKDFKDLNEYHVSRVREHEKSQNTSNKIKQVKLKIR
ncbi:toprim domain-containing protein [Prevotella intermedia]|uniref:Probable DNA primase n=1 Tax=Prevotella intermedia TaxID=28131 RepID=A0A0T7AQ02_PREIN|nr:toprim domain-containing protein [Prevotella intermedia]AWX08220.1 mobilization protein [Prevotella intermedia]BAU17213.1 probable DNA primase [Prevotella intermedia]BAU17778.1 probable DNA primase [Prevotella intermedia]BAU18832.1 probable DNA primase [Prevotella intermedia]BAU19208.1 probable DNA primase [Prevotella intermedia]